MFTNPFGWRLDAELISVHGLTISNHAQCGVPQGLFLVRSIITHFSAMCPGGSNCKYPFLLPFYDEISLCTRPSSLSFCDEKYPGCPFYAWTPWLFFFVFDISSFKHADASTQVPNIRSSSKKLNYTTVLHDNLRRNSRSLFFFSESCYKNLVLALTQTINRNRQSLFTGLLHWIGPLFLNILLMDGWTKCFAN